MQRKSKKDTKKSEKNNKKDTTPENPQKQETKIQEQKAVAETKTEAPSQPPQEQIKYLFFKKDDLIKATANAGNGWSYGGIVENFADMNKTPRIQGFFPVAYISVLSSGEQTEPENQEDSEQVNTDQMTPEELQAKQYEEMMKKRQSYTECQQTFDPHDSYASFAMGNFGNEEALTIEYRRKMLAKQLRDPEEKAGVTNAHNDHGGNNHRADAHNHRGGGDNHRGGGGSHRGGGSFANKQNDSVQNQKKVQMQSDQSPLAKAYRQLNYYFDYESWNDNRNARPNPKSKPNAKFKKKKKFHL